MQLEFT